MRLRMGTEAGEFEGFYICGLRYRQFHKNEHFGDSCELLGALKVKQNLIVKFLSLSPQDTNSGEWANSKIHLKRQFRAKFRRTIRSCFLFIIGVQLRWLGENKEYARIVGHIWLWPVIDINIQLVSPHIVYWHYLFINQNSKVNH